MYTARMNNYHTPVLLNEAISYLNVQKDHWYIDCNLGGGGHTTKILELGGKILGIDLDQEALDHVHQKLDSYIHNGQLILHKGNFKDLKEIASSHGLKDVSGILFDLGVSSHQFDDSHRGFSFQKDAPLDMRMDQSFGATAADLINGLHESELANLFWKLGEEQHSRRIAKKIVEARINSQITTTKHLADLISSSVPHNPNTHLHPATKVFQALRIAVNTELENLTLALPQAFDLLAKSGRLVVISFHSLEDRIVKDFIREKESDGMHEILTNKPVTPSEEELLNNPRSRSSKLRSAQKG